MPQSPRAATAAGASVILALLACLLAACAGEPAPRDPLVVFLVRHAEKADTGGSDPELTAAGRRRANALVRLVREAGIEHVHSSDYARTRDTAAPAARALGLEVELYDPRDLPSLVEELRRLGGRHLVVGHSNTTPQAVTLLGGEPGSEIDEASEYDRLYVVTAGDGAAVSTVLLRYGARGGAAGPPPG